MIYLLQIYLSVGHLTQVYDELEKLRLKKVGYRTRPINKANKVLRSTEDSI